MFRRRAASTGGCRGCLHPEDMTQLRHPDTGATTTAITESQAAALEKLGWVRQSDDAAQTQPSTSRPSKPKSEEAP